MKIRTKLILLLSAALVATTFASTYVRIRLTRTSLESALRESAKDTAFAIGDELTKRLTPEMTEDEIKEELKEAERRHPVTYLNLRFSDDEADATFSLTSQMEEPQVARRSTKPKTPVQRREEARRALIDHGDSSRKPSGRFAQPMWRTSDRPESSRFPPRASAALGPRAESKTIQEGERGENPVFEVPLTIYPEGRRGDLIIALSREGIEQVIRAEKLASVEITGGAIFLLVVLTTLIVNGVVGRPVSALQGAMKRVESGALDERVEEGSSDEVGALSRGFNAMIHRLGEADSEIRAFNRRLADEVRGATLDLERKNEVLAQLNRLLLDARRELGDKERLAALGQLAAQLAHEIGTPLGSVSGHLQLALSARDLPQNLKDRLQVAGSELERISKIVRDYLDSTRRVVPERTVVDLARLVDEALGIALSEEARGKLRVEKRIDPRATQVESDPGLLRQILINLLTNAVDAIAHTDGAGRIAIDASVGARGVELSVRDDGSGIPPEDLARIFEPFYTTKGRGKGTGLGLAICRELVQSLGGRLAVESAPGQGSTFTILLPASEPMRNAS